MKLKSIIINHAFNNILIFKSKKFTFWIKSDRAFDLDNAVISGSIVIFYNQNPFYLLFNRNLKPKQAIVEKELFFKFIPLLSDLVLYSKWFSDKKIDYQIDRIIKLQVFS